MQMVVTTQQTNSTQSLREVLYAGFQGIDPRTFNGASRDPTKTQLWQSSIKTIFLLMNCLDDQKVTSASFMLKNDAELWSGYNGEILSQDWKCDTINIFFACMFIIIILSIYI